MTRLSSVQHLYAEKIHTIAKQIVVKNMKVCKCYTLSSSQAYLFPQTINCTCNTEENSACFDFNYQPHFQVPIKILPLQVGTGCYRGRYNNGVARNSSQISAEVKSRPCRSSWLRSSSSGVLHYFVYLFRLSAISKVKPGVLFKIAHVSETYSMYLSCVS